MRISPFTITTNTTIIITYRSFRFGTIECAFIPITHYHALEIVQSTCSERMVTCNIVPWELMAEFIYKIYDENLLVFTAAPCSLFFSCLHRKFVVFASENQLPCEKFQRLMRTLPAVVIARTHTHAHTKLLLNFGCHDIFFIKNLWHS